MTVRIKICGITNEEDALTAAQLGADAIGFVFARSPRQIAPERAKQIVEVLPPFVQTVGVFVDADPGEVTRVASLCRLDVLQFHGGESAAYCGSIDRRIIKAIRMRSRNDLDGLTEYSGTVDGILLDTYVPNTHGGTGQTFDWSLALEAKKYGRIILAGGLNPENVVAAIQQVRPYAVDASSALERRPGLKDHKKVAQFIKKVCEAAKE
jgi:phosphoribosylanthranilate isomerase